MTTDYVIRPAVGQDLSFIYDSMLNNLKYDSSMGKSMRTSVFMREYRKVVDYILSKHSTNVAVACNPEDPNVVYGYGIFEPDVIHFIFVKEAFRRFGIAKNLIRLMDAKGQIYFTHQTGFVRKIIRGHLHYIYNPVLLQKQGALPGG